MPTSIVESPSGAELQLPGLIGLCGRRCADDSSPSVRILGGAHTRGGRRRGGGRQARTSGPLRLVLKPTASHSTASSKTPSAPTASRRSAPALWHPNQRQTVWRWAQVGGSCAAGSELLLSSDVGDHWGVDFHTCAPLERPCATQPPVRCSACRPLRSTTPYATPKSLPLAPTAALREPRPAHPPSALLVVVVAVHTASSLGVSTRACCAPLPASSCRREGGKEGSQSEEGDERESGNIKEREGEGERRGEERRRR